MSSGAAAKGKEGGAINEASAASSLRSLTQAHSAA